MNRRGVTLAVKTRRNLHQLLANSIWLLRKRCSPFSVLRRSNPPSDIYEAPASYRDLIHPEDRLRVLTKLEEAGNTGRFGEEFRILRADGALRWISCTASAVPEPDQRAR